MQNGTKVEIRTNDGEGTHSLTGTIVRVWDKPAADPYVTVRTDDNRTFVRCSSVVKILSA